ncbi:hypothetical protein [Vibrio fluvialis]|uniref:hypothetical protein n=1 Tax=Vibrio fluvialis TaxID=676 RepID=UPI0003576F19|nr:hypothetical protein [Vibrio fluvialis]EPP25595.1 hypothetical protein L911_1288 [Vibrio fluvialis I21563]MBL4307659.1 hypothetical protein [Vibrio fluvialis]MBY7770012.1 hypothetical protein [Vibrio fluvialis]MBY7861868.1 hypothetical protein [Vibrio fluvialis]MBY8094466.1 hypothetical protein [Vibrio fluvialis]
MNKWRWMSVAVMACWSLTSTAAHPDFLPPYLLGKNVDEAAFAERSDWIECSEMPSVKKWCSEPFAYYATTVWAQVAFHHGRSSEMVLHADYSMYNWSQLQLGLRKDGFQLQHAQLDLATFDVAQQMQIQSWQATDKALVVFLNQHARAFPKTLIWRHQDAQAKLFTDGSDITLTFTRTVSAP